MEYRPVTEQERLELMELQARSFFFTYDRKKYADEVARSDAWQRGRAAFDDGGRLVAGLELIPFDAWFDGAPAGMGGIGGVASSPEDRRGGNVRGLFLAVLNEMRERGDTFSYLYPFSFSYYRKFGYETGMRLIKLKAPLEQLLALRQPGRAERFVPGEGGTDPAPVIEIYNDFAPQYNLCVDRDAWRWRDLLEHDPVTSRRHAYLWHTEDGRPGAYVIFRPQPERDPDELHVLDAAWRSREALLGLLGFLSGFSSNLKTVAWELPPGVNPEYLWPECRDFRAETSYQGMSRVVHAQKALRLMRKPEGSGSVRVSVNDAFLPANTGVYKIDWENGGGGVRKVKGSAADLECSAAALAQLVTGYLPFSGTRLRADVSVNGNAEALAKLFVKKDIYMMDRF